MKYLLASLILVLLPPTRCFALKRMLLGTLGIRVGKGTKVCGAVKFYGAGRVAIGDDCWIGMGTAFYTAAGGDIAIADRCDIAPEVAFHSGSHHVGSASRRAGMGTAASIRVGAGCWIGLRSSVLAGADIGDSCVIGAQSLILGRSYPASSLLFGVPARIVRALTEAGES